MTQKIVAGDRYTEVYVEPLGVPAEARQLTASSSSTNVELTSTCRRLSMRAVNADIRYSVGSIAQTATSSSHFIAEGERIDIALPQTPHIAIIRNAATDGTLEITELL